MAELIRMPRMSDTMTEGVIVAWHKKVGDKVVAGDVLAEVETDKATMELESYQEGVLLHIGVAEGAAVEVEGILAILGEKGEDVSKILKEEAEKPKQGAAKEEAPAKAAAPMKPAATAKPAAPVHVPSPTPVHSAPSPGGRTKASPLAKRLAADKGIDIALVPGSGDEGRIVKRDIEAFLKNGAPQGKAAANGAAQTSAPIVLPTVVGEEQFEDVALSQMRKTIARRLAESKFQAPHFYLRMEVNMDKVVAARKQLNEFSDVKISFNDIVVKAAAIALRKHPAVNASWLEDRIRYNKHIHIGVAVAVEEGLLVPVLRFADNKTLSHLSAETRELAGKAKSKKLQPDEMSGNTFTISNLGMFGIDEFTAIINPPDSCIMAVGAINQTPKVIDGEVKPVHIMKVTLSCDHRVVDGAKGALFLKTFRDLIEEPMRLLV